MLLFEEPSHFVVSDHAMCAPLPRSFANAGGCPISGARPLLGPNLSDAHFVTGVGSHSSRMYEANELRGIPSGYASLV